MVVSVEDVCHTISDVSEEQALTLFKSQLKSLDLHSNTSCCSYGFSQDLVPYGMLPNGKRMPQLRRLVNLWVDNMIELGMRNFLCPMEQGIDMMVAERVFARKSIMDKPLKLIACLTHPDMEKDIGLLFHEDFLSLCKQADAVLYADSKSGGRKARHVINQGLADNCSHILVAYQSNKPPQALKDAQEKGLTIAHIQTDKLL